MPDPQKALAPIIEPLAPPVLPTGPDFLLPALAMAGAMLLLALAVWLWRRRAPLRQLRRIERLLDTALGAGQLATWVRAQGIQPAPDWQADLERLRFGPPADDAAATLAWLCRDLDRHSRAGGNPGSLSYGTKQPNEDTGFPPARE